MIQHANLRARLRDDVEASQRLPCLHQPQEVKGAVQHPGVGIGSNHRGGAAIDADAANHVALGSGALQAQRQCLDHRRTARRAEEHRPGLAGLTDQGDGLAREAGKTPQQLALRGLAESAEPERRRTSSRTFDSSAGYSRASAA